MAKRTGRCVCGLRVALHYDRYNHKLSCEETRERFPRATCKSVTFNEAIQELGLSRAAKLLTFRSK